MNSWWQHAVIYQIYPRSFYDGNNDGVGDLKGILQKLEYVRDLGVDAVWISPFYPSPMRDFGYDIVDFCAVDPLFGTLDDFWAVLDKAHRLNLRVLIDQVWCHTSDQHPWFLDSVADRHGDKADWFVWVDADADGQPPNNWLATFGGSAWQWHPERGQFYLHHFLREQPALNWYNPAVREAMLGIGRFWLDLGVDGFRFDVINFLMHDPQLRDNPPRPDGHPLPAGGSRRNPFFHWINQYNIDQPQSYEMLATIRALLDEYPDKTSLAEISVAEDALAQAGNAIGPQRLHMAYNSALMTEEPLTAAHLNDVIEKALPLIANSGLCWTAGTHDFPRIASRWHAQVKDHDAFDQEVFNFLIAVLILSLPGPCCLYQGDELGLPEAELEFKDLRDPYGIDNYPDLKGRDGCRTPFPWHADRKHLGFSEADDPWLPPFAEHRQLAANRQHPNPNALLNKYRRLIAWRKHQLALSASVSIELLHVHPAIFSFVRGLDTDSPLLFLLNFSQSAIRLATDDLAPYFHRDRPGHHTEGSRLLDQWLEIPSHGVYVADARQPAPDCHTDTMRLRKS